MSSRAVVAVVIALACVVLILAWFMRDERAVAQATAPAPSGETPAAQPAQPANLHDSAEIPQVSASTPPSELVEAPKPRDASPTTTEPVLCTVYGFVRPAEGTELANDVALNFTDHLGQRELAHADGTGAYSLSGLAPGAWWVSCGSQAARARARIELDASEPNRRLDLTLTASPEVRVKVTSPSGEPVSAPWLLGVATLTAPGEWFEEVRGSLNNTFGVGAWQNGLGGKQPTPPYIGSIVLDVEPPVYVSLVRYQRVLATVRVEARGRDAEFVLDPNSLLLSPATLRARAVDSASGAPLAEASAELESNVLQMSRPDPTQPGVASFARLTPGRYELVFRLKDYAESRTSLLIDAGATLDLGDIRMEPGQSIDGLVVDEAGNPVETILKCDVFDRATGRALRTMVGRGYQSDASGHFRVSGLARKEYLLAFDDRESSFGRCAQLVDTRNGSIEGLRVVLARGVSLVVLPPADQTATMRYTVRNAAGVPVLSTRLWTVAPVALRFAPGAYTVEVEMPNGAAPRVHKVVLADEPVELELP